MTVLTGILILLVGVFLGSTTTFAIAWYLDNFHKKETMRRAIAVRSYMNEFPDVTPMQAYEVIQYMNFDYK